MSTTAVQPFAKRRSLLQITHALNVDEPIFGVHDMYGYRESGVRGVDDLGIVGAQLDNARIFTNEGSTYGRVGNQFLMVH